MKYFAAFLIALLMVGCAPTKSTEITISAETTTLPTDAKQLTGDQIRAFLAGNTFQFDVHDAGKPLTGTSTWESERGIVFGEYSLDHQSPKPWKRAWWVEGDKNCTRSGDNPPECQMIYVDGDRFFEIREDGGVHAISTPVHTK
jgi:hypothetical protein